MTENSSGRRRRPSMSVEEIQLVATVLKSSLPFLPLARGLIDRFEKIVKQNESSDYQRIVQAYRDGVRVDAPDLEVDDDAEVSMGEDPGAYVMSWTWVDAADAGLCRTCSASYSGAGDGYDGECADCADKTEAAREVVCARCGDKTTAGESPDEEHCPDCFESLENTV